MDDGERIPIDLAYEVAGEAAAQPADPRTTLREDGTLVIDILAPQPCASAPSSDEEITVCAQASAGQQPLAPPPPEPTPMERLQQALTVKVGPVEIGPGMDGGAGFTARIRF